jgi:hypothetical protein
MIYWSMDLTSGGNCVLQYARALALVGADVRVFPQAPFDRHDDLYQAAPEFRGRVGPSDGQPPDAAVFCLPPERAGARLLQVDELPPRAFVLLTDALPTVRKLVLRRLAGAAGVFVLPEYGFDASVLRDAGCHVHELPMVNDGWPQRPSRRGMATVIGPLGERLTELVRDAVRGRLVGLVRVYVTGGDVAGVKRAMEEAMPRRQRLGLVRVDVRPLPTFLPTPEVVADVSGSWDVYEVEPSESLIYGELEGAPLLQVGELLRGVLG